MWFLINDTTAQVEMQECDIFNVFKLGHRFDHIFGGISGIYGINGTLHNEHKKQKALYF